MAETRYLSFEETLGKLGMEENELLDLISANEIRAFRIDREMKFKETDVQVMLSGPPAESAAASAQVDVVDLEDAELVELDVPQAAAAPVAAGALGLAEEVPPAAAEPSEDGATVFLDEGSDLEIPDLEAEGTAPAVEERDEATVAASTEVALESAPGEGTELVLETTPSDGLGTEEIVFEDEDLAIDGMDEYDAGTQEVTVREKPISEELTIVEDEEFAEGTEITVKDEVAPVSARLQRSSRRRSARISGAASVRRKAMLVAARAPSNPVMVGFLIFTLVLMIYPMTVFATIAMRGFATRPVVTPSGEISHGGLVPEYGTIYIPKHLDRFTRGFDLDSGNPDKGLPRQWWGTKPRPQATGDKKKTSDEETGEETTDPEKEGAEDKEEGGEKEGGNGKDNKSDDDEEGGAEEVG